MTRISIVEDQKDVADNTAMMIRATPDLEVAGVYYSAESALSMLAADRADIVLMDIQLPGMNGVECLIQLRKTLPDVAVLMFTAFDDDPLLFDALRFGAKGYILKEDRFLGIMRAIRAYLKGDAPMSPRIANKVLAFFQNQAKQKKQGDKLQGLTNRQNEVVRLVAKGLHNQEIADRLGITNNTTRRHISDILKRLELDNRTELALRWRDR